MLYRPALSVIVERVFSIRAGLDASTVAPGNTAPEESCTRPEMLACAAACAGTRSIAAQINTSAVSNRRIRGLLGESGKFACRAGFSHGTHAVGRIDVLGEMSEGRNRGGYRGIAPGPRRQAPAIAAPSASAAAPVNTRRQADRKAPAMAS